MRAASRRCTVQRPEGGACKPLSGAYDSRLINSAHGRCGVQPRLIAEGGACNSGSRAPVADDRAGGEACSSNRDGRRSVQAAGVRCTPCKARLDRPHAVSFPFSYPFCSCEPWTRASLLLGCHGRDRAGGPDVFIPSPSARAHARCAAPDSGIGSRRYVRVSQPAVRSKLTSPRFRAAERSRHLLGGTSKRPVGSQSRQPYERPKDRRIARTTLDNAREPRLVKTDSPNLLPKSRGQFTAMTALVGNETLAVWTGLTRSALSSPSRAPVDAATLLHRCAWSAMGKIDTERAPSHRAGPSAANVSPVRRSVFWKAKSMSVVTRRVRMPGRMAAPCNSPNVHLDTCPLPQTSKCAIAPLCIC